ncbi:MAG: EAL domain-containing protein, partial [Bdellovibrionales bacterium]
IINVKDHVISGFEALMRWTHPEHGFISPGVFIPIAEESGLIIEASEWCLEEACNTLKRIESRIGKDRTLTMSVNFTSKDFSEDEFLGMLYNIISKTDINPSQIQLEVTEDLLKEQPEKAKQTLNLCREAGLKIALDNFSNAGDLERLNGIPIDCLKIDRKYTSQMTKDHDSSEFIRRVIDYGNDNNLTVVAEGIEEKEEVSKLQGFGADFGQGYFFAKPMTERDLNDIIKDWKMPEI